MSKRDAKRQTIIQAAIDVFGRQSFQNSSISEIAQKANIAEGSIYQYFKNKEDLFFSIPLEKSNEFCKQLELHLDGIEGALNKIRKFIWYYLYFFKTNPEYGRILMLEMRVSKSFVRTKTYEAIKQSATRLLEIIDEGQKEGVIRDDVDRYAARQLILGVLEHMVTRWLLEDESYDLLNYYQDVSQLVVDGVKQSS